MEKVNTFESPREPGKGAIPVRVKCIENHSGVSVRKEIFSRRRWRYPTVIRGAFDGMSWEGGCI